MVKRHIKRLTAPNTWNLKRKEGTFTAKPLPSGFTNKLSVSLVYLLRYILKVARTAKEVRNILITKEVLVDNKKIIELKYGVGLMDVISIPAIQKQYRLIITQAGYVAAVEISAQESSMKPLKIVAKNKVRTGKLQYTLLDGTTFFDTTNYKKGDSVLFDTQHKKVKDHFAFTAGNYVYLIDGKSIGKHGVLESMDEKIITLSTPNGEKIQTLKEYGMIIGKKSAAVTVEHKA